MTGLAKSLGKRIKERRKKLGLTQKAFAELCGFNSLQIVSSIEKGEREIKAWELSRIADSLKMEIREFFEKMPVSVVPSVLWRQQPDKDPKLIEAEFLKLCDRYHHVEKLCGIEVPCKLTEVPPIEVEWDSFEYSDVDSLIQTIGPILNLGSRPAASLIRVLEERCGVKIFHQELEGASAASIIGDFGPAILMNRNEAPWRRNYNFAHELFHLITWRSIPSNMTSEKSPLWDKMEKLANHFAACLLLPMEALEMELEKAIENNKIGYIDLVNIARDFEVSTLALLWRSVSLRFLKRREAEKVINDPKFQELDKATMHEKWWNPPPLPERFVRLAFYAYVKGRLSRMKLAEYLDTSLVDLEEALAEYGIGEGAGYETQISIA